MPPMTIAGPPSAGFVLCSRFIKVGDCHEYTIDGSDFLQLLCGASLVFGACRGRAQLARHVGYRGIGWCMLHHVGPQMILALFLITCLGLGYLWGKHDGVAWGLIAFAIVSPWVWHG